MKNTRLGHITTVVTGRKPATWFASCEACGKVGPECDFEGDAEAIADRHAEIGGFER